MPRPRDALQRSSNPGLGCVASGPHRADSRHQPPHRLKENATVSLKIAGRYPRRTAQDVRTERGEWVAPPRKTISLASGPIERIIRFGASRFCSRLVGELIWRSVAAGP